MLKEKNWNELLKLQVSKILNAVNYSLEEPSM